MVRDYWLGLGSPHANLIGVNSGCAHPERKEDGYNDADLAAFHGSRGMKARYGLCFTGGLHRQFLHRVGRAGKQISFKIVRQ